jgi:putative DNA primase/helicase
MMTQQHAAHVNAWVKHHARQLSRKPIADGFKPQALHGYTNTDGNPTHWRIRLKHPDTGEKWIRPLMREGAGFALKQPDYPNGVPLYRLHELTARPDEPVHIVEGETCADALAKLGILATTSGAADSAGKADWSILAGGIVTIWPDNDEAGLRYAETVKAVLEGIGCTVAVIDVAVLDLPVKGDCVDWLAAHPGAVAADLLALPKTGAPESTVSDDQGAGEAEIPTEESDDDRIARLAALPALEYDRCRVAQAKAMGVQLKTLDGMVKAARADDDQPQTPFAEVEAWGEPVNPAALLSEVADTIRLFIVLEPKQADAAALWVAFTWFADVVEVAPLAIINAPEKACGKSQLLTLFGRLVARPLPAANSTAAFLFRGIEVWEPTVLIDEADTFIRENEELKGLVNAGHTRANAFVGRVVGDNHEPRLFKVWGAKALAGIALEKHLPDSTMSRAVVFNMRRKLSGETVARLRHADAGLFDRLASQFARFADDYREQVRTARPALPDALDDRAQDNWEPLLSIAQCAGTAWLQRATAAALELSGKDDASQSAGNELLADIQAVFESKHTDKISMADLVAALIADDECAWSTWNRGKPLNTRQLGRMLRGYGINSKVIRFNAYEKSPPKGFDLSQFADAFARYLSAPPENADFSVTKTQPNNSAAFSVTDTPDTNPESHTSVTLKPFLHKACDPVTEKTPIFRGADEASFSSEVF